MVAVGAVRGPLLGVPGSGGASSTMRPHLTDTHAAIFDVSCDTEPLVFFDAWPLANRPHPSVPVQVTPDFSHLLCATAVLTHLFRDFAPAHPFLFRLCFASNHDSDEELGSIHDA